MKNRILLAGLLCLCSLDLVAKDQSKDLAKPQEKIDFNGAIVETHSEAKTYSKEVKKTLKIKPDKKRDTVVFIQPKNQAETVAAPSADIKGPARTGYKAQRKLEKQQFERLANELQE